MKEYAESQEKAEFVLQTVKDMHDSVSKAYDSLMKKSFVLFTFTLGILFYIFSQLQGAWSNLGIIAIGAVYFTITILLSCIMIAPRKFKGKGDYAENISHGEYYSQPLVNMKLGLARSYDKDIKENNNLVLSSAKIIRTSALISTLCLPILLFFIFFKG